MTNGAKVERAKDFRDSGEYIVTLPSGRKVRIYRDTSGASFAVWYVVGYDHQSGHSGPIGFKKEELVEQLVTIDANTPKRTVLYPNQRIKRASR